MTQDRAQILTARQMSDAEQRLIDGGSSIGELMECAAAGAAEWVRRIAAGRSVTVLCGPGNNGGDGYVIARRLRDSGLEVRVIAPVEPKTDAAVTARRNWGGDVETTGGLLEGHVLVDALFGSGLARPLSGEHALLLRDLASRHALTIAIDMPSGVPSDDGRLLNDKLPRADVTLALGAWKFAHWLLPGREWCGRKRLVPIGITSVEDAARLVTRPKLSPPGTSAHKYKRGLAAVVSGEMPGAPMLAAMAAQRAGAGYVKLLGGCNSAPDPALVCDDRALAEALDDSRIAAILVGPGLGRDEHARERLNAVLRADVPSVLDADALNLLQPKMLDAGRAILATPHDGELDSLCRHFAVIAEGRRQRALGLARASGMCVLAKGPDSVIAAPDGRLALVPPAPSWLSVAGSGDVLAGIAVSRMANGRDPFAAACEAAWLHGKAARDCGAAFTARDLAKNVSGAIAACL
ncbi:NAD(P)H-hydrate dehydratase [Qipengyuania nanhaisediminis]|uniref:NAD(P)H-hydrate dehydratase n=1 Tax=Qipengyuania nanhaisediminis TaxID=604088 RepID=UPI0038B3FC88